MPDWHTGYMQIQKVYKWLMGGIILAMTLLFICIYSLPDGNLHVFVLDIGQGDSVLVTTAANEHILVDGGPDDEVIEQLSRVMPFYERTIDLVILTHPHADHVDGLAEVLKRYRVKQVMITGMSGYSPGYIAFLNEIVRQKIPILFAGSGKDYRFGNLILDVIYPFESLQGVHFENLNNGSIVFRLIYGERIFYFSGDAETEEEEKILVTGLDLRADFYKVGHHGSRTSSGVHLLERIQPLYAVISCGVDNKFKHPHGITLQHLHERNIKIYRTDLDGTIEAVSDGRNLAFKRAKS